MGLLVGLRICLTPPLTHRICWRDVSILAMGAISNYLPAAYADCVPQGGGPRGAGAVCAPLGSAPAQEGG